MTSLQQIPWVERIPIEPQTIPTQGVHGDSKKVNLYGISWVKSLIHSPWPQFLLRIITLAGFVFTIAAGLLGSRVGSHNFAIIFVWIAWWTALKLVFIPLGGRSWCSVCPIPLPGEWLQQGGILKPGKRQSGMMLRWPKKLKGSWMQSGGFLLIGLFSATTLTDPRVTGWILLALFCLAIGLSLVFEKRAFCSYLCPIGGFSGMYAQSSPVELRVINKEICTKHNVKSCYQACPWGLYPVGFRDNSACGMCMECLRACPHDNLALNIRSFGADLGGQKRHSRLDEAFLALVMLGSAIAFSAVFLGPWGWLKSAAFEIGSSAWIGYAIGYLALTILLLPSLFVICVRLGEIRTEEKISINRSIATYAQVLIPLGLMAWLAFTVSFALPKIDLVLNVINDPFGFGWKLLGIFDPIKFLDLTQSSKIIQVVLLLVGMFWSAGISRKISMTRGKSSALVNIPVLGFCLGFTLMMLWLLIG